MRRLTGPGAASENSSRPASRIGSGLTRNALPATGAGASSASEAGADSGSGAGAGAVLTGATSAGVTLTGDSLAAGAALTGAPPPGAAPPPVAPATISGSPGRTVTTTDAEPVAPRLSVTVSRAVHVPAR